MKKINICDELIMKIINQVINEITDIKNIKETNLNTSKWIINDLFHIYYKGSLIIYKNLEFKISDKSMAQLQNLILNKIEKLNLQSVIEQYDKELPDFHELLNIITKEKSFKEDCQEICTLHDLIQKRLSTNSQYVQPKFDKQNLQNPKNITILDKYLESTEIWIWWNGLGFENQEELINKYFKFPNKEKNFDYENIYCIYVLEKENQRKNTEYKNICEWWGNLSENEKQKLCKKYYSDNNINISMTYSQIWTIQAKESCENNILPSTCGRENNCINCERYKPSIKEKIKFADVDTIIWWENLINSEKFKYRENFYYGIEKIQIERKYKLK